MNKKQKIPKFVKMKMVILRVCPKCDFNTLDGIVGCPKCWERSNK